MGFTAYLSKKERELLIQHIVRAGENYQRFQEWCDINLIPQERRFTPVYLKNWCQRRRGKIQDYRKMITEEAKKGSLKDKTNRLNMLEEQVDRLKLIAESNDLSITDRIKVEEQIRKALESIAKERGEFNHGGGNEDGPDLRDILIQITKARNTVDGEVLEIAEESTV